MAGGYNFAIVVGNSTSNPNVSLWAENVGKFLVTDFMDMKQSVGLTYGYASTDGGAQRYALIGGTDKESIDYANRLSPPVLFTGRNRAVDSLVIANATVEGNTYTFTNNNFTGTQNPPSPGYFGYVPGTKRTAFAAELPVTGLPNQN